MRNRIDAPNAVRLSGVFGLRQGLTPALFLNRIAPPQRPSAGEFRHSRSHYQPSTGSIPDPPGTERNTFWTREGHCFSPPPGVPRQRNPNAIRHLCLSPIPGNPNKKLYYLLPSPFMDPRGVRGVKMGRVWGRFGGAFFAPAGVPVNANPIQSDSYARRPFPATLTDIFSSAPPPLT
jgi:hypothetical protein